MLYLFMFLFLATLYAIQLVYVHREALIDLLIAHAEKTPYFDLPGYMRRNWLVPYNVVIRRTIPAWDGVIRPGAICNPEPYVVTDGTGPVDWRKRPITRLIQKCNIAIRVHEILRSDKGRDPHDHPWWYLTIILRNGYYETRFDDKGNFVSYRYHGPGSIIFRRANSWHRLDLLPNADGTFKPAVTIFITGKKSQTWGFNVRGEKVPYYDYIDEDLNGGRKS